MFLLVPCSGVKDLPNNEQHLFLGYDGTLKMGILPVSVFCSGHTFFTQRMFKKLKLEVRAGFRDLNLEGQMRVLL